MQYILTSDEYKELLDEADKAVEPDVLQWLCSLVANHTPIEREWDKGNKNPWGCILTNNAYYGYCDDCPVAEVCKYHGKRWSK